MPQRKLQLNISGFTDGINTEASALNVLPSEMMLGTTNIELLNNGEVRPRRAIDFIGANSSGNFMHELRTSSRGDELKQESPTPYRVELNAPNGAVVDRIVVDINNEFHIYEVTNAGLKEGGAPLQVLTRNRTHDNQKFYTMSFAQSGDKLYFAGRHSQPGYLKVGSDNTSLELEYFDVTVRDSGAIAENTVRKVGDAWYECKEAHTSSADNKPGSGADEQRYWFQKDGKAPTGVTAWANATSYTSNLVKLYDKNAVPVSTDTYPTTVAFFAGRVWLSGDPKNPNDELFSVVIVKDSDTELFLQRADPFFEDDPDLVKNDGGVISIQGSGLIMQHVAVANSLFIGTTLNIWQVTGPSGIFEATDFSVNSILADGVGSNKSMAKVRDELVIFGYTNIWKSEINTSTASTDTGRAAFTSISEERIQSYYDSIPRDVKDAALAVYNESEQRIYFFHNASKTDFERAHNTYKQPGYYTSCLIVDTRFRDDVIDNQQDPTNLNRRVRGAFFIYDFADTGLEGKPYIAAPFVCKDVPPNNDPVVIDTDAVTVDGDPVVTAANASSKDVILFLAMSRSNSGGNTTINRGFGTFNTSVLRDWDSDTNNAVYYDAIILSGLQTFGNIQVNKNIMYLFFVFKKVETGILDEDNMDSNPGSCLLSTAWNWSDTSGHPKFSSQQEIYVPLRWNYGLIDSGDDGETHKKYKHRVRGRGHTMQLKLQNTQGKDFRLVGWTQQFTGGTT